MSAVHDLLDAYAVASPADAALGLAALPTGEAVEALAGCRAATAAALLRHLPGASATRILDACDEVDVGAIGRELPADILAAMLRRLGDRASRVIDRLEPAAADRVRVLLSWPDGTAGAIMDPDVRTVPVAATAGLARDGIRGGTPPFGEPIYAVDAGHVLVGVVNVAGLLEATDAEAVSAHLLPGIEWVRVEMPLPAVEAHPGWEHDDVLPVVDAARRLVGSIRHRRLRQLAHEHAGGARDDRAVRTLVSLGEVYWLGLSGLLQGLSTVVQRPAAGAPQRRQP